MSTLASTKEQHKFEHIGIAPVKESGGAGISEYAELAWRTREQTLLTQRWERRAAEVFAANPLGSDFDFQERMRQLVQPYLRLISMRAHMIEAAEPDSKTFHAMMESLDYHCIDRVRRDRLGLPQKAAFSEHPELVDPTLRQLIASAGQAVAEAFPHVDEKALLRPELDWFGPLPRTLLDHTIHVADRNAKSWQRGHH